MNDNGYLIVANTSFQNKYQLALFRTDENGVLKWSKNVDGFSIKWSIRADDNRIFQNFEAINVFNNDSFCVFTINNNNSQTYSILHFDNNGNLTTVSQIDTFKACTSCDNKIQGSILPLNEKGYLFSPDGFDIFMVSLTGRKMWSLKSVTSKYFSENNLEKTNHIIETTDGYYAAVGVDIANGIYPNNSIFLKFGINYPPIFLSTPDTIYDTILEDVKFNLKLSAKDTFPGDVVYYSLKDSVLQGMSLNYRTGELLWTPDEPYKIDNIIRVYASDRLNQTDTQLIFIHVIPVNDPPIFKSDTVRITLFPNSTLDTSLLATDQDDTVLFYSIHTTSISSITISNNGRLKWTPQIGDTGIKFINISVTDGKLFDTLVVLISIDSTSNVNSPPSKNKEPFLIYISNGYLTIYNYCKTINSTITIFNLLGKKLYCLKINNLKSTHIVLPLKKEKLQNGIIIVKISNENTLFTSKLLFTSNH
jgi:hypothetical protein